MTAYKSVFRDEITAHLSARRRELSHEAYRHYERPNSSNSNGFATGSHVYQNVTIETIYGCKYCGHIERRRSKKREQLDRDSL